MCGYVSVCCGFFAYECPFVPVPFIETNQNKTPVLSPLNPLCTFAKNQLSISISVYFCVLFLCFYPSTNSTLLRDCSDIGRLNIQYSGIFHFFVVAKIILAILGPIFSHIIHFRANLSKCTVT